MIPSAMPRNVARVLPSRAAASTQTNLPVRLEREAIFDDGGQGREVRDAGNLDAVAHSRACKVTQLARIGSCDQNPSHHYSRGAALSAAVPSADLERAVKASCPNGRRDAGATVFSDTRTRTIAIIEIRPPALRSQVRTKAI